MTQFKNYIFISDLQQNSETYFLKKANSRSRPALYQPDKAFENDLSLSKFI